MIFSTHFSPRKTAADEKSKNKQEPPLASKTSKIIGMLHMTCFGVLWVLLGAFGCFGMLLGCFGVLWGAMVCFGVLWMLLSVFDLL